jgi:hypothetical protein
MYAFLNDMCGKCGFSILILFLLLQIKYVLNKYAGVSLRRILGSQRDGKLHYNELHANILVKEKTSSGALPASCSPGGAKLINHLLRM